MSLFKDFVVLELSSVLAGPSVGQFFAELGAEVIKVENAKGGGDVTRSWKSSDEMTDDRSAYFCSVNWGKQSIAVDLTSPEGRRIVHQLALESDIVIASYKPGDAEKLGVDYASLARESPRLIYGRITGYGSNSERVGYDAILQAESGFMSMNGEPNGPSLKMPVALIDVLAGHQLKEGLLLALLERNATGTGRLVEVSLLDAAVSSLANQATNFLIGGYTPSKQGSAHPNIAPYGDLFTTADGREIILAVGTDRQFRQLCKLLDIGDAGNFADNPSRLQNRVALNAVLQREIGQRNCHALLEVLHREKIPAGTIRNVKEVLEDPAISRLIIDGGGLRGMRTFVGGNSASILPHLLPPPRLGQHSRTILEKKLNIAPGEVNLLFESRIVAEPK